MMISVSTDISTTDISSTREPLSLRANAGSSVRADGRRRVTPELLSPAAVRPLLLLQPVARPAPLTAYVDAAEARVRATAELRAAAAEHQWLREVVLALRQQRRRRTAAADDDDDDEQEQEQDRAAPQA